MAEFTTDLPEGTKVCVVDAFDRYTLRFLTPDGTTVGLSMAPAEFDSFEDFATEGFMRGGSEVTL